ncbi:MAG: hypothetical protein GY803_10330 [Chloroflexi bacterium]|nr:hypothetical protein [Chloroflexota bacterium]
MTTTLPNLMIAALFGTASLLLGAAALLPAPRWIDANPKAGFVNKDRRSLSRFGLYTVSSVVLAGAMLATGLPVFLSTMLGGLLTLLLIPLFTTNQQKKREKKARREALTIAEYIAGRLNSSATLLTSLESLLAEHKSGGRSIPICASGLDSALRAINLGQPLGENLRLLAEAYSDLPEVSGLWTGLAIMAESTLGVEAMAAQANDLAKNLASLDEIKDFLVTELTQITQSRLAMIFLVGGLSAYLVFSNGPFGDVLIHTLAGNILLGFAVFTLYLAQVVGAYNEKLPPMWF